jgi:hypothetical protein
MTWKFPGTDRVGSGSTSLEDMGLWEERERIAKRLYKKSIHNNSFAGWDDLNERQRKPWLKLAEAEMKAADGVAETSAEPQLQRNGGQR